MKNGITFDKSKKVFPIIVMSIGIILALTLLILRLNLIAVVNVAYMCITSAITILGILICKKLYKWFFLGYSASALSIVLYYAIWGADAGFGAFSSGKAGWNSTANALFSGESSYNFFVRFGGNILLILPCIIALLALYFAGKKQFAKKSVHFTVTALLSLVLAGATVFYVLTMNLRSKPNVERLC
ncbi:MAG: hypothetical protein K2G60_03530 [Oscillospiraceae bacterium]|nr:hypothetical protein [Oscillospiraceae bacterium]